MVESRPDQYWYRQISFWGSFLFKFHARYSDGELVISKFPGDSPITLPDCRRSEPNLFYLVAFVIITWGKLASFLPLTNILQFRDLRESHNLIEILYSTSLAIMSYVPRNSLLWPQNDEYLRNYQYAILLEGKSWFLSCPEVKFLEDTVRPGPAGELFSLINKLEIRLISGGSTRSFKAQTQFFCPCKRCSFREEIHATQTQ